MASNVKYSVALKNGQQDQITTKVGASGAIDLYSGTQPANPDTAITSQVLLATLPASATFAPASSAGVLTANAFSAGTGTASAGAGTVATWFRLRTSAGVGVIDGTVGISGADLNLTNTNIAQNQPVSISGFTDTNQN